MRRSFVFILVMVFALGLASAPSDAEPLAGASRFVAVQPVRILNTRDGGAAPLAANATIDVQITGVAGVPISNVTAVVLNTTATEARGPGYVQVFPTGRANVGDSSNLNIERAGQTIPNLAIVPIGNDGKVSFYTEGGAHLLADLLGYFVTSSATTAGRYVGVSPTRVMDTRSGSGVAIENPGDVKNCSDFATWDAANNYFWTYYERFGDVAKLDQDNNQVPCESLSGVPSTRTPAKPANVFRVAAGGTVKVQVRGAGPVPASGVGAVVLNVTATDANPGFVQVIPTGGPTALGQTSNLNITPSSPTIPNAVVVPVGSDGSLTLFSEAGAHLLVDVLGYFTDTSAPSSVNGLFVPLRPQRLLDTRNAIPVATPKPSAGGSVTLGVRAGAGLPSDARAAVLNVTATESTNPGYVQAFPTGEATAGSSSNLNVTAAGQTIPNAVVATLSTAAGQITLYTESGTHMLVDIAGYFTGASGS